MAQKKSKERREEPLGTISYQTSSQRSPPFWLLIGARKLLCFSGLYRELWRHRERLAYPRLQNRPYFAVDSPIHFLNNWSRDRPIRLTQCFTQFKPFGNKMFCFRNFHIIQMWLPHYNYCKYNTQRILTLGDLNWVQHWVIRIGLWSATLPVLHGCDRVALKWIVR